MKLRNAHPLSLTLIVAILMAIPRAGFPGCFTDALQILTPSQEDQQVYRLRLDPARVRLQTFARGKVNRVYELLGRDPENPAAFPADPHLPSSVQGRPVEHFVLKVSDVNDAFAQRDTATLEAIQNSLRDPRDYEGIHLAPTFIVPGTPFVPRLILQERSNGISLYRALESYLRPALRPGNYDFYAAHDLLAHILEGDLKGWKPERIFSPENLRGAKGEPLAVSAQAIRDLRKGWTQDPEVMRIRLLLKNLYRLSRSKRLALANVRHRWGKGFIANTMPWSTERRLLPRANPIRDYFKPPLPGVAEYANADFSPLNFKMEQDAAGVWQLVIVDF